MSIGNLGKPPVFVEDASDWAYKKWFNDVYRYSQSGILIPDGGQLSLPVFPTHRRNLVMNGDFQVWQRGTSVAALGTSPQWTADRWAIAASIGVQTIAKDVSTLPGILTSAKNLRPVGNATPQNLFLAQAIESAKIEQIAGLPFVFSYWVYFGSSFVTFTQPQSLGNASGHLLSVCNTGTGVDEGPIVTFTGSKNVSILGITPTAPQLGVWLYYSQSGIIPATAKEMKVYFEYTSTATAADANAYCKITGVQLEIGYTPTAFAYQSFSDSLFDCSRFYQKSFDYATVAAQNTGIDAGVQTGVCVVASTTLKCDLDDTSFVPTMYKTPTITYYNPRAAAATAWNYRAAAVSGVAATNVNASTKRLGTKVLLLAGGDTVDDLIGIHWDASADI